MPSVALSVAGSLTPSTINLWSQINFSWSELPPLPWHCTQRSKVRVVFFALFPISYVFLLGRPENILYRTAEVDSDIVIADFGMWVIHTRIWFLGYYWQTPFYSPLRCWNSTRQSKAPALTRRAVAYCSGQSRLYRTGGACRSRPRQGRWRVVDWVSFASCSLFKRY